MAALPIITSFCTSYPSLSGGDWIKELVAWAGAAVKLFDSLIYGYLYFLTIWWFP